ncbi:MAG: S-layer homology domain-containing protein [Clostridiales bacterium]|jgi:hypothetical protein|nr:S-layer homology domain-containing protein [Clostridiales bacterium]
MKLRHVKKVVAVLLMISVLLSPLSASSASVSFADVSTSYWAASPINYWAQQGVIFGYGDGKFHPEDQLTLAQYSSILNQVWKYSVSAPNVYPDLPADKWYTPIILKLIAAGVVTPAANGLVQPEKQITRGEMFVLTAKAYKIAPRAGATTFLDDASIPADQKPYINALAYYGIVVGYQVTGGYEVRATQQLTRAENIQVFDVAEKAYQEQKDKILAGTAVSDPATWAPPLRPGGSAGGSGFKVPGYTPSGSGISYGSLTPSAVTSSATN